MTNGGNWQAGHLLEDMVPSVLFVFERLVRRSEDCWDVTWSLRCQPLG